MCHAFFGKRLLDYENYYGPPCFIILVIRLLQTKFLYQVCYNCVFVANHTVLPHLVYFICNKVLWAKCQSKSFCSLDACLNTKACILIITSCICSCTIVVLVHNKVLTISYMPTCLVHFYALLILDGCVFYIHKR